MDLIESDGGAVVPVDYKRGNRPQVAKGAYDPASAAASLKRHGHRPQPRRSL